MHACMQYTINTYSLHLFGMGIDMLAVYLHIEIAQGTVPVSDQSA